MPPPDERDLGAVLRAEADRHEPDRAAMLRRINQARSGRAMGRRRLPAVRPMAAAAAVAGVLVLAVAGIELAGRSPAPTTPVAAPPSATVSATPDPSPSRAGTAGPASPRHSTSSLGPPVATSTGRLTAVPALDPHSIATWAQSNLTVTTTEKLTALDVTIKVARTAGVAKTGHWTSIPAELTVQTVDTSTGSLLYRFTLKDGATLAPGSYTFAAQYNHAAGTRSTAGDRWTATAGRGAAAAGGTVQLSGDFG